MTTPQVQYEYADGSANTIRPTRMVYPDGRELNYSYGDANEIDDSASRVASYLDDDGTSHLIDYAYLGAGSIVEVAEPEPELLYTLVGTAGGNDPDTGDIYRGLDRFGRVKDLVWRDEGEDVDAVRIQHGYDRAGNRLWRKDPVASSESAAFDELYHYDGLYRLINMQRGTLNTAKTGLEPSSETFGQCWNLDATGNWSQFREATTGSAWGLIQNRISNTVNEITDITESTGPAWFVPSYNRAGNMTGIPQPADPTVTFTATYDAWNRLAKLIDTSSSDTISEYQYDGRKFRVIQKSYIDGDLDQTRHYYLTSGWQVIEERVDSETTAERQFVWGQRYIDDLIIRDRGEERLYGLQDPNWNMVAIADAGGDIQERYAYSAYGVPVFLDAAFEPTSPADDWETLYCGYRYESVVGLYHVRHRVLHPVLGNWVQRDPIGYAGGMGLYAAYFAVNGVDPEGLQEFRGPGGFINPGPGVPIFPTPEQQPQPVPITPSECNNGNEERLPLPKNDKDCNGFCIGTYKGMAAEMDVECNLTKFTPSKANGFACTNPKSVKDGCKMIVDRFMAIQKNKDGWALNLCSSCSCDWSNAKSLQKGDTIKRVEFNDTTVGQKVPLVGVCEYSLTGTIKVKVKGGTILVAGCKK